MTTHTHELDVTAEQTIPVDLLEALDSDDDIPQKKSNVCANCKNRYH